MSAGSVAGTGIVEKLMAITLFGSEWVLWLLLILSVVSVGVALERVVFLWRTRAQDFNGFLRQLSEHLAKGRVDEARKLSAQSEALEHRIAVTAIDAGPMGADSVSKMVSSVILRERQVMERGLVILGTLGNNTPFIGLFGTVLGIIQAFHALSENPAGGSAVVMAGISEALIATAVGLLVAIPAVIAFNGLQRVVKGRIANAESVQELVLSYMLSIDDQTGRDAA